jgi:hypothetical protein
MNPHKTSKNKNYQTNPLKPPSASFQTPSAFPIEPKLDPAKTPAIMKVIHSRED